MRILLAMDDSDFARQALEKTIHLATLEESRVFVITVIPQLGSIDELSPAMTERMRTAGEAILHGAEERLNAVGITCETMLEQGVSPADNIIRAAVETAADLIVMGHRGRANLEKFLLGSVAWRVISHAACSVLIVR